MGDSFFYSIKSKIVSFVADIKILKYPPFIIPYGGSSYKLKGHHLRYILNTLKPGDILLRRYDGFVGTMFIAGYFSHAAAYLGDDQVLHMLGDGITVEDILTFTRCDDLAILRFSDQDMIDNAIITGKEYLEKNIKYDFNFNSSSDKFYCTELLANMYEPLEKQFISKPHIIPDDFLTSLDIKIIWEGLRKANKNIVIPKLYTNRFSTFFHNL